MCCAKLHSPVLFNEAIEGLNIRRDGVYIDATFGRGGHSQAILDRLNEQGRLLMIDRDPEAIAFAQTHFAKDGRCQIVQAPFSEVAQICSSAGLNGKVDGILVDLGVSSPQLDQAERGFSFMQEGPLDMRMDPSQGISASEWLETVSEAELTKVLFEFGEERNSRKIAKAIIQQRAESPLRTTRQLANLIEAIAPRRGERKHPATRTFQAIRIAINDELGELNQFLHAVPQLLAPFGRFAAISFHSLEDRMVKRFMRAKTNVTADLPIGIPIVSEALAPVMRLVGKAIKAGDTEIELNPRARSAVLRVVEKVG